MDYILTFNDNTKLMVQENSKEKEIKVRCDTLTDLVKIGERFISTNLKTIRISNIAGDTIGVYYDKYLEKITVDNFIATFELGQYTQEELLLKDIQTRVGIQDRALLEVMSMIG